MYTLRALLVRGTVDIQMLLCFKLCWTTINLDTFNDVLRNILYD